MFGTVNATTFIGDLTGTSDVATTWASVTSFIAKWFYDNSNVLTFNETALNTAIDARDTDTTYTAGDGMLLSTTTFSVNAGNGLTQDPSGLSVTDEGISDQQINNSYINQILTTTSTPTFGTINTGQGANELYDMDQNVLEASDVIFNTVTLPTFINHTLVDGVTRYFSNGCYEKVNSTGIYTIC